MRSQEKIWRNFRNEKTTKRRNKYVTTHMQTVEFFEQMRPVMLMKPDK